MGCDGEFLQAHISHLHPLTETPYHDLMLPKLLLIILVAGAAAAALLVNRQHRIDASHEISTIHQRMLNQEQVLWRLRADIAGQVRPDAVRERMNRIGGAWAAIPELPSKRLPRRLLHIADRAEQPADEHEPPNEEQIGG